MDQKSKFLAFVQLMLGLIKFAKPNLKSTRFNVEGYDLEITKSEFDNSVYYIKLAKHGDERRLWFELCLGQGRLMGFGIHRQDFSESWGGQFFHPENVMWLAEYERNPKRGTYTPENPGYILKYDGTGRVYTIMLYPRSDSVFQYSFYKGEPASLQVISSGAHVEDQDRLSKVLGRDDETLHVMDLLIPSWFNEAMVFQNIWEQSGLADQDLEFFESLVLSAAK